MLLRALTLNLLLIYPVVAEQTIPVSQLSWMTGHWKGAASHGGVIEENWTTPRDGSIANLARLSADGKIELFEMILIEEEAGSLVLRLQQWEAGYLQKLAAPQKMRLVDIGEFMVRFESASEGPFKLLQYSRPANNTLVIKFEDERGMFEVSLEKINARF